MNSPSVRSENRGESSGVSKKCHSENRRKQYTSIHKSYLGRLTKYKDMWLEATRRAKLGRYKGINLGDRMIGAAMAMVPKAGCSGFSTALPIAVAGVLENLGLPVQDTSFLPGKDKVSDMLTEQAIDSILEVQESILKNPFVFISADKGNKAGNKNLAKYICWYDKELKRVRKFLLDVDCSDEDTKDTALALKHALERVWPPDGPIYLMGQCNDSGGGRTLHALAQELNALGLCHKQYFVTSCTLHNPQQV